MSCTGEPQQGIAGFSFVPGSTVTILTRVPGDAVTYPAGTTSVLDDGSFRVVVPIAALMPWCDPASGVSAPLNAWELDLEVWTTSDASGQPTLAHDPHYIYPTSMTAVTTPQLTSDDARNLVSGYLGGDPQHADASLSANPITIYSGGMGPDAHILVRHDAGANVPADEYVVDSIAGEIVSIYLPRATSQYAPRAAQEMSEDEARQQAAAWASAVFGGFDQLEFVQGMTQGGFAGVLGNPPADLIYTATWRLRDPVSGGWLPTGVTARIDLATGQDLSYEAVLIGRSAPALYVIDETGDCASTPYVSGLGFLPGTTVEVYGWPEGGNRVALVAEPLTVGEDGTFMVNLDLARFTGCADRQGATGFYGKRFGITAVTRRNPADELNGLADPTASAAFTVLDPGPEATPSTTP
jgi:hypothetical protein